MPIFNNGEYGLECECVVCVTLIAIRSLVASKYAFPQKEALATPNSGLESQSPTVTEISQSIVLHPYWRKSPQILKLPTATPTEVIPNYLTHKCNTNSNWNPNVDCRDPSLDWIGI